MSAPKRLYYKIGEACKLLEIQPYVLRYWETEFPVLAPSKSKSGQRVYSESELAIIRRIKSLLYDEGFTIAGAKKRLDVELASGNVAPRENGEEENGSPPRTLLPFSSGDPLAVPLLDTQAGEQIEKLREGISDALRQARQLLQSLGPKPSS